MKIQPLSQRDSRWGELYIGNSKSKIKDFGCAIVCLAMLADTTPDIVESKLSFSVDRIIWTSINNTDLPIRFPDMGRNYVYDNDKVKEAINKNGGCLVEVDFDGIITTKNDRHWILYVGNGKAYDPWTGTEISTSKYPIVKGFCIINKIIINSNNNMTEEQKRILEFLNGKTEGDVRQAFGALTDLPTLNKNISDQSKQIEVLDGQINGLTIQVNDLIEKFNNNEKSLTSCQSELRIANKTISNLTAENTKLSADRSQYKSWYEAALKDQVNKYTGWQLIRMGVKLLIKKSK